MTEHKAAKYIEFVRIPGQVGVKTSEWTIRSKSNGCAIGSIKWYGPWRQYCFHTVAFCVFNKDCLDYVIQFIEEQMATRKS